MSRAEPLKSTSGGVALVLGRSGPKKTPINAPAGPEMRRLPNARARDVEKDEPSGGVCGFAFPSTSTNPVALICTTCPVATVTGTSTGAFNGLLSLPTWRPSDAPARAISATPNTLAEIGRGDPAAMLTVTVKDPLLSL